MVGGIGRIERASLKRIVVAIVIVVLNTCPLIIGSAHAGSNSLVTLGFGAELGLSRFAQPGFDSDYGFLAEITARLRLFRFLGASFSYNLGSASGSGELSFASKFRLTALLYLYPGERASVYVIGGFGSRDIRDIVDLQGSTTSYHGGAGIEVYIGRRFAVHVDYLMVVPGSASIHQAIDRRTEETVQALEAEAVGVEPVAAPVQTRLPAVSFGDFLDAGNFQITIGVRIFI